MENNQQLTLVVERILSDFPELVAQSSEQEVQIHLRTASNPTDSDLVGIYTAEGLTRGEITEADIRDDCVQFFRERAN